MPELHIPTATCQITRADTCARIASPPNLTEYESPHALCCSMAISRIARFPIPVLSRSSHVPVQNAENR